MVRHERRRSAGRRLSAESPERSSDSLAARRALRRRRAAPRVCELEGRRLRPRPGPARPPRVRRYRLAGGPGARACPPRSASSSGLSPTNSTSARAASWSMTMPRSRTAARPSSGGPRFGRVRVGRGPGSRRPCATAFASGESFLSSWPTSASTVVGAGLAQVSCDRLHVRRPSSARPARRSRAAARPRRGRGRCRPRPRPRRSPRRAAEVLDRVLPDASRSRRSARIDFGRSVPVIR